jgi:hypothetical protein
MENRHFRIIAFFALGVAIRPLTILGIIAVFLCLAVIAWTYEKGK